MLDSGRGIECVLVGQQPVGRAGGGQLPPLPAAASSQPLLQTAATAACKRLRPREIIKEERYKSACIRGVQVCGCVGCSRQGVRKRASVVG